MIEPHFTVPSHKALPIAEDTFGNLIRDCLAHICIENAVIKSQERGPVMDAVLTTDAEWVLNHVSHAFAVILRDGFLEIGKESDSWP